MYSRVVVKDALMSLDSPSVEGFFKRETFLAQHARRGSKWGKPAEHCGRETNDS